ncbi:81_t:CDS:2 [Scutellospora calospora]|uniref:81_t:CDS:1 n=1 Tax=Scutellospora calospora TaxID=85575 RepID=A0ACA9KM16_9GLOM|nr:81_t:CDS:2 [Scutellospora calospora]
MNFPHAIRALISMAHKHTEDFPKILDDLISELDIIEKSGIEIFSKIENSFSYPCQISSIAAELSTLLTAIQHFESRARSNGVTSLCTTSDQAGTTSTTNTPMTKQKLTNMIDEVKLAAEELSKESKRIADNARAELSG